MAHLLAAATEHTGQSQQSGICQNSVHRVQMRVDSLRNSSCDKYMVISLMVVSFLCLHFIFVYSVFSHVSLLWADNHFVVLWTFRVCILSLVCIHLRGRLIIQVLSSFKQYNWTILYSCRISTLTLFTLFNYRRHSGPFVWFQINLLTFRKDVCVTLLTEKLITGQY